MIMIKNDDFKDLRFLIKFGNTVTKHTFLKTHMAKITTC
jgi:hypothetical protein